MKSTKKYPEPRLLILNQMAGPMTWELAEDLGMALGSVAMFTGHPDTLDKGSTSTVQLYKAAVYQRGSFIVRAASWLKYLFQAFFWLWRWPRRIPLLLFSNPPMLCWLGYLMSILRGLRYAVMVHDIYPDVLIKLGGFSRSDSLIRLWRLLNRLAYQRAEVVMTLGEFMVTNLNKQFDSQKTKAGVVEIIYPWVDTNRIKPLSKEENWFAKKYGQLNKLTIMYSGNMGLGHDLESIIQAAKELKNDTEFHFLLVGDGPKWKTIRDLIQVFDLDNVTLLPWQSEKVLPYSLATADVSIVSLEAGLEGLSIPSKTLYSMAVSSAVIGLGKSESEMYQWITKYECGYGIDPGNSAKLVEKLKLFLVNEEKLLSCKYNSKVTVDLLYERHKNIKKMLDVFRGVNFLEIIH